MIQMTNFNNFYTRGADMKTGSLYNYCNNVKSEENRDRVRIFISFLAILFRVEKHLT